MNTVMIIPTGIGCEIGGHAGDATPAARLLGAVSDKLILHPNVVNASDINEMPANALYVEGSILDRFLRGDIELKEIKSNRILVVVNKPVRSETVNAVNAVRTTLGVSTWMLELDTKLEMIGDVHHNVAGGVVNGWEELVKQVKKYSTMFDALAIATEIKVDRNTCKTYFKNGGINPWGGIEAIASKLIANALNKPVAHAPIQPPEVLIEDQNNEWDFVCDPRMAAEIVSNCFLHCVMKGLHKAPRIGKGLSIDDVDVLVSPAGCWSKPHDFCRNAGKTVIIVKENTTTLENRYPSGGDIIFVQNYCEAAGVITAIGKGINLPSLTRPIESVFVKQNNQSAESEASK